MSGGGGGHIIIRSMIRPAAETSSVQDNLSPDNRTGLQQILAKPDGNWTDRETRFVIRKIAEAYDQVC